MSEQHHECEQAVTRFREWMQGYDGAIRKLKPKENPMAGTFEVYKDKADKFRFRLKAQNGEVIASGTPLESKAACLNHIESVKKNCVDAVIDDQTGE